MIFPLPDTRAFVACSRRETIYAGKVWAGIGTRAKLKAQKFCAARTF
jgi:hypothetical protein